MSMSIDNTQNFTNQSKPDESKIHFSWCPIEIGSLFSSPWFQAMKDFQRGWYLCLLLRAWERTPQLQLPNDDCALQVLAGVTDSRLWQAHKKLVLDRFLVSTDGKTLSNPKLLEVYERQIRKHNQYVKAGKRGGRPKGCLPEKQGLSIPLASLKPGLAGASDSLSLSFSSSKSSFQKPTIEEVKTYIGERGNLINADRFYNTYEANGWQVGSVAIRDWKALARKWETNRHDNGNGRREETEDEREARINRIAQPVRSK
jgi:hypothetical protein